MRVRGNFLVWLDLTGSTAGDVVRVGLGLLVQQADVVSTSLPLTDGQAPFFWYEVVTLATEFAIATAGEGPTAGAQLFRGVIDGKAMRVLRPDQEVQSIVQTADVVGAPVINGAVDVRFLIAD